MRNEKHPTTIHCVVKGVIEECHDVNIMGKQSHFTTPVFRVFSEKKEHFCSIFPLQNTIFVMVIFSRREHSNSAQSS